MSELQKEEVRETFIILIVNEWGRIRDKRVLSVEEECEMFKSTVMTCAARVCEYRSTGKEKRGSALRDEEIKEMVREKRRLFEIYVADRNEQNREEYRQKNLEVKRITRQKKNEVDERDGIQLTTAVRNFFQKSIPRCAKKPKTMFFANSFFHVFQA